MATEHPGRMPELIVFDLDFTLWDCGGTWCDCLSPPFRSKGPRVTDRTGRHIRLYDDVNAILEFCRMEKIALALASRTEQPPWARQLVQMLEIDHYFALAEIYPSSKLKHFQALQSASGVEFCEMLFFDDEMRNIREVSTLDVTCVHVADGMTRALFDDSLARHAGRSADGDGTVQWNA
ncbi:Acid Phosphatase [Crateriforma conspicua]|uniref:Acid Phosphatase n=1 Tax=Crateriforma conspicua TaxID=2527996 RepID=A0A5C6FKW6_9PLAN|nr:magnesium-dependent phosphatase-1 [Crateriforma conspicua]TWU62089.1 Acid Phosphatase [Crateriforma conspicua]